MYEPYGEEKSRFNLKEKFNQLKQKIQEKFRSIKNPSIEDAGMETENKFKFNKITITAVALAMLLFVGGITSYVTYTGKIDELQSQNLVLEKQKDSAQTELNNVNQQLSACYNDLESMNSEMTRLTLEYQTSQTNLEVCNEEKVFLSSDLNLVSEELEDLKLDYEKLENDYSNLEDDLNHVTCNYAKSTCGSAGMDYYYLSGEDRVVCCLNEDTCVKEPEDLNDIIGIDC